MMTGYYFPEVAINFSPNHLGKYLSPPVLPVKVQEITEDNLSYKLKRHRGRLSPAMPIIINILQLRSSGSQLLYLLRNLSELFLIKLREPFQLVHKKDQRIIFLHFKLRLMVCDHRARNNCYHSDGI